MTRRRWIADEVSGSRAALLGSHAEHLCKVLRARVGQEFDIATGKVVRSGRISAIDLHRVEFELGEEVPVKKLPPVTLLLSIFKFDRMEWAIEKCTELGVARIVPIVARRTESHLASAATNRVARWARIASQAAEQSRRLASPEISDPVTAKEAAAFVASDRVLLSESEQGIMLRDLIEESAGDVALAIGPEGGWTSTEVEMFTGAGWTPASLGTTILRAETAAVAAMALAMSVLQ